jgi:outer membrane protein OmpA-like peptidoglycan-associated protein
MDEDWSIDVKKYVPNADDGVIAAIVRYCGIALRNRDSSLVSFTDPEETARVRENYLKKKLGLTEPDSVLDAAIAKVGEVMSADTTRNRVTVYYLLAQAFGKLDVFGWVAPVAAAAAVAAPAAAKAEPQRRTATASAKGLWAPMTLLLLGGLGILAGIVSCSGDEATTVAVVTPAPVAAPAPEVPTGSGVVAVVVEGEPMVSIYFDTAKSDIHSDFESRTADLRSYLAAHPGTHLQISGYNDPRGNAAFNAELSKSRAFAVRDALAKLGVPLTAMDLVKPVNTTDTTDSLAQARRVDVTVEDGPVTVIEAVADPVSGAITETVTEIAPAPAQ